MEKDNTSIGTEFENRCEISPCRKGIVKIPSNPFMSLGIKPKSRQLNPKISLMRKSNQSAETIITDFNMEWVKSSFSKSVGKFRDSSPRSQ
jgi:hypothetical protein